ncbi:MAG: CAP domain-containing protein, partial [Noviherbaspirillum sp.]
TGAKLEDRLRAAGFRFTQSNYAFGEVISATGDTSGFNAADDLITAIYHRFVILEPMFTEAGSASATVPNGYTYFTTDFAANGLGPGLASGVIATYPVPDQANIPTVFFSDRETPDPVQDRNEVGFPISVHANITSTIAVQSMVVHASGGAPLPTRLLTTANDPTNTRLSVAAIVPLAPLAPQTLYQVEFVGSVDDVPVSRSWSFRTR